MPDQPVSVSVCLITYNHEAYIKQAIESILMQQVNFSWEIIIADDNSKDNTRQIISRYAEQYPDLIKPLFRPKNVGPGKNFVDLINAATGKYVAYLEGDDYWSDVSKLQQQFDFLETHPGFSLCYHKIRWHHMLPYECMTMMVSNENDKPVTTIGDLLERGWFIRSCSMLFKRINLPEDFTKLYVGDYPLHVLLADKGNIGFIDHAMAVYRINEQGLSETRLLVTDVKKIKTNFRNEIDVCKYLDEKTGFKYRRAFRKKMFDAFYAHMWTLVKKFRLHIPKELFDSLRMLGPGLIITGVFRKLFQKNVVEAS